MGARKKEPVMVTKSVTLTYELRTTVEVPEDMDDREVARSMTNEGLDPTRERGVRSIIGHVRDSGARYSGGPLEQPARVFLPSDELGEDHFHIPSRVHSVQDEPQGTGHDLDPDQ